MLAHSLAVGPQRRSCSRHYAARLRQPVTSSRRRGTRRLGESRRLGKRTRSSGVVSQSAAGCERRLLLRRGGARISLAAHVAALGSRVVCKGALGLAQTHRRHLPTSTVLRPRSPRRLAALFSFDQRLNAAALGEGLVRDASRWKPSLRACSTARRLCASRKSADRIADVSQYVACSGGPLHALESRSSSSISSARIRFLAGAEEATESDQLAPARLFRFLQDGESVRRPKARRDRSGRAARSAFHGW
jgi:hypothetical protein